MVTTTSYQLLLERLQSLTERAMSLDVPKPFFLTLFEFVEIYDKDERLGPVIKVFNQLKKNDIKKETELGEKAKKEMRQVYKDLVQIKNNEKLLQNRFFQEGLQHFEAYEREDGSIESIAGPIVGRHGCIIHALISIPFEDQELKNLVSHLGEKDDQGKIVRWVFAPSFDLWEEETKYIQRLLPTKVWHSWDKLVSFYGLYKDFEKLRDDKLKKKEVFSVIGLNMLFQELNDIMNYKKDTKRYLREFDVGEYKVHLQRIFTHTKELVLTDLSIGDQQNPTTTNKSTIAFTFNDENTTLAIKDKQIKFKKDTRKLAMLKLLIKKPKGIYFGEIAEELEGVGTDKTMNTKNIYYEACRSIEHSFVKVGIPDFLNYNFNQAKINPTYKKITK